MTTPFIHPFNAALPVWPAGRSTLMNDFVLFRAVFTASKGVSCLLRLAASTLYRIKCNGAFLASGPARGPRNVFRVDELDLPVTDGENIVEIEVSGCNVNSYYYMDHFSFLQAEICCCGTPVVWTGNNFSAFDLSGERIRKSPRMSFQRMFTENYRLAPVRIAGQECQLETLPEVLLMPRAIPQPEYRIDTSYRKVKELRRRYAAELTLPAARYLDDIGPGGFKGFHRHELEVNTYDEVLRFVRDDNGPVQSSLYEGAVNNSGFLRVRVNCVKPGRLVTLFSEIEEECGGVDPLRLTAICAIIWELTEPGEYELESLEPYTFKFVETFMADGEAVVTGVEMREFKSPMLIRPELACSDEELNTIYRAGCETFAANAVDCFTDCPSRERGGWLCDSFFIARTSKLLTGSDLLERFFLENFAWTDKFEGLPEGAFPMVFPADHPNGEFIPNWGMWLILELEEYLQRSGDRELIDVFQDKVLAFIKYLDTFLNSDGLLEKLPSWVFIEWSRSNDFVQDVNYPSNMTYAATLESVARLYGMPELAERARTMRNTIRQQSWNGMWFCDHAIRKPDGTLEIQQEDISETCQYYAFFFKTATPESHPELWQRLRDEFGPRRIAEGVHPEIHPANAFIGNYLRLELLASNGLLHQSIDECKGYFKKMADRTGTLWEHDSTQASCCHGFAAYVNVLLDRQYRK